MSESKNIVITGGARGLGRAMARYLALRGHRLFLLDVDEEELKYTATVHIPQVLAQISGESSGEKLSLPEKAPKSVPVAEEGSTTSKQEDVEGPQKEEPSTNGTKSNGTHGNAIHFAAVNLRDPQAVREAVKSAAEVFGGKIDVLVNNAGIARAQWTSKRSMDDVSINDEWIAYIETNLTGPFLVSQACIPFMKLEDEERKEEEFSIRREAQVSAAGKAQHEITASIGSSTPCIINVSSFRALQSAPNCEGYASSKAGLLGLTHSMAISLGKWGIRVNAILPGFIYVLHECREGDETGHTWAQPVPESRHRTHPTGRIGRGDDVAKTVEWLMEADFVTGQEIVVDGGCSKIKYEHA